MAATLVKAPDENPALQGKGPPGGERDAAFALLSFLNTALAMSLFGIVFHRAGAAGLWIAALGLSGVMAILTFATPSKKFAAAAGLQSLALLALAVPLYFDRVAITGAWAALGLALAVYARLADSRAARTWMFIMLLLVAGRTVTFDLLDATLRPTLFTLGTLAVTRWTLVGWGAALYALLLAWLAAPPAPAADAPPAKSADALGWTLAAIFIGTLLAVVTGVIGSSDSDTFTLLMILWGALLTGFSRALRHALARDAVETLILILLAVLAFKWAMNEGLALSILSDARRAQTPPLLNLFGLNAVLLAGLLLVNRAAGALKAAPGLLGWWIAALAFTAVNVETLRGIDYFVANMNVRGVGDAWIMKNIALSVLWGAIGFGAVVAGFILRKPPVRWVALGLLGLTVGKVLLVDMANVHTVLRVLSFLVTGGLLLVVSYIYHRVARAAAAPDPAPPAEALPGDPAVRP
jgi:uncharacterized membrane protein